MNRLAILRRIDEIRQDCKGCPINTRNTPDCEGCATYDKLREQGELLLSGSRNKKARAILAKGQDMTLSEVEQLLDRDEIPKGEIARALGMSRSDFYKWLKQTKTKRRTADMALTKEQYIAFKQQGMTDHKIRENLGWHNVKFNKWKNENLTDEDREKLSLKKGAKQPDTSVLKSDNVNVPEPTQNATDEPETANNEPLVKLKPEVEKETIAKKLKREYREHLEAEVKEQVQKLADENMHLKQQFSNRGNEISNLKRLLEGETTARKNVEARNAELRQQTRELKLENAGLTAENDKLHTQVKVVLETSANKLANKDAEINALKSNNEDLQSEIDRLREEADVKERVQSVRVQTVEVADTRIEQENAALKTLVKLYL